MPELPEVETIVNDLNQKIKNLIINDFWSDTPRAIHYKSLPTFKKILKNKKILSIQRIGKNIFIFLSSQKILHIHLRMTGHLLFKNTTANNNTLLKEKVNQYIHHIWYFSNNTELAFSDLRKFASISLLNEKDFQVYLQKKAIGIDALDKKLTLKKFDSLLNSKPQTPIGIFLLDQSLISGIGNIYRSEILFASKILPERKNKSLKKDERKKIFLATRKILKLAIKMRGTSDSDYRDASGAPGHFQKMLKVYHRDKLPCPNGCGGIILRKKIAQRSVFYCLNCQK